MAHDYERKRDEIEGDLLQVLADKSDWEFVTEKREVEVWSKTFGDDVLTTFKGQGVIAKPTKHILEYLIDENKRGEWDLFFDKGGIVKKFNERTGIVFYQTKSTYTVWPRDFTLLVSGTKLNDDQIKQLNIDITGIEVTEENAPYLITAASIDYEEREVPSSHVVGKVQRGGFLLIPIRIGDQVYTFATYVIQVDVAGWVPYSVMNMVNTYQPLGIIGIRKALTGSSLPHPNYTPPNEN